MIRSGALRMLTVVLLLLGSGPATAQLPLGGGGNSGEQQSGGARGDSATSDVAELVESGGSLLVDLIRPESDRPSVQNPRWNSLKSPRSTVLTFREAMEHIAEGREGVWDRALKTLETPAEVTEPQARERAQLLAEVLDRLGPIQSTQLPSATEVQERGQSRFELFPRGISHQWVWDRLDDPPRGKIVLREVSPGTWKFSRRTLEQLPEMFESIKSLPPRYDDPESGGAFMSTFRSPLRRTDWRGWALLGAWIIGGLIIGVALKWIIRRIANQLHRHGWTASATLARSFSVPVALVCLTVGIAFGTSAVRLDPTLSEFRWDLVRLLLVLAVLWAAYNLIDLIGDALRATIKAHRSNFREMAVTVVIRMLRVFAVIIFFIFVLQNVFSWDIGALLAGLGIAGLAVSLAGQDSVKNLFGAVTIFVNRPFVIGDWITFKEMTGEVRDVTMQCTRMRDLSGHLITIPNMQFIDNAVQNYMVRPFIRREMDIQITYDTPAEKVDEAIQIVHDVLRDDEVAEEGMFDFDQMPPRVAFDSFGSHYLNIKVYYWYRIVGGAQDPRANQRGWFTYMDHCTQVNRRILKRFNEAGIDFAFPTRTLYLTDDPDRGLAMEASTEPRPSDDGADDKADED